MQKDFGGGEGTRLLEKRRARLKGAVLCALMAALSIIFGKYLSISTELFRISFENLTVVLAGVLLGPLYGAAVGACADIVGCLMIGYTINPIITAGAALTGFAAGGVFGILRGLGISGMRAVYPSVMCGHVLGSMLVKTLGLWVYYRQPFSLLVLRVPLYLVIGSLEAYAVGLLLRHRGFMRAVSSGLPEKRRDIFRSAAQSDKDGGKV